jgi:PAS domain S-box-containing protein
MAGEKIKVLLVDDDQGDVRLTQEMVKAAGANQYELAVVGTLDGAIDCLRQNVFDAVLLDLNLPDSQGVMTIKSIQGNVSGLPVIVLTGLADEAIALEALKLGAEDYLVKGKFDGSILVRSLRYAIERKRAESELRESKMLFETVVENIPLMIFLKEATDLRFVIFNRAGEDLLGYGRKDLLGKNNLDLFPPEQAANFMTKDREVLDGETGFVNIPEEAITTAKRGVRMLHTQKVCVKGADGVTKYLLGISEDITERKLAEQELKKKVADLEIFYKAAMDREDKILELKAKIEELKKIIDTKL